MFRFAQLLGAGEDPDASFSVRRWCVVGSERSDEPGTGVKESQETLSALTLTLGGTLQTLRNPANPANLCESVVSEVKSPEMRKTLGIPGVLPP
jgi:hypothetical protein